MGPPLNGIDYLLLALLGFVPATGSARRRGGRTALQAGQIGACRRGRRVYCSRKREGGQGRFTIRC